jgi:hypothetical protein
MPAGVGGKVALTGRMPVVAECAARYFLPGALSSRDMNPMAKTPIQIWNKGKPAGLSKDPLTKKLIRWALARSRTDKKPGLENLKELLLISRAVGKARVQFVKMENANNKTMDDAGRKAVSELTVVMRKDLARLIGKVNNKTTVLRDMLQASLDSAQTFLNTPSLDTARAALKESRHFSGFADSTTGDEARPLLGTQITFQNRLSDAVKLFQRRGPYDRRAVQSHRIQPDQAIEDLLDTIEQLDGSIQQQSSGEALKAVNPSIAKRLFGAK